MSDSFIDKLLAEAELEICSDLEKSANDENGAPDAPSNQEQGGGDILTTAQAFLQKIEQFKAALSQGGAQAVEDPNAQPNQKDQPAEAAAQQAVGATTSGNSTVMIQRPDGTQIKLASLTKLASARGSKLFKEVN